MLQLQAEPQQDTFQKSQQLVRFGSMQAPGGSDEGDPDPNRYPFNLHLLAETTSDERLPSGWNPLHGPMGQFEPPPENSAEQDINTSDDPPHTWSAAKLRRNAALIKKAIETSMMNGST
jgi:hypothetical protein